MVNNSFHKKENVWNVQVENNGFLMKENVHLYEHVVILL